MAWALWLLPTLAVPTLAALWTWWRGWRSRPAKTPTSDDAMRAHRDYLDALVVPARGTHRVERH